MSHVPAGADQTSESHGEVTGGALGPKGIGWGMFEWARNPYYNVVVIYVFAPYFAASVVNNGAMGQTLVSLTITIAGVIMAIIAPVLGTIVDKAGSKKPFIFIVLGIMGIASLLLGLVTPDLPGAIPIGMLLMIIGYCCYSVSELLHNAMLPGAGRAKSLPLISGLGLSLGNAAGVIALIAVLIAAQSGFLGYSASEISRLSAPFIAIWLFVFIGVFFWLMPDVYKTGATWSAALSEARNPSNRVNPYTWIKSKFKEHPNVMRYLLGRMIYADGVAALLTIGGVYVTGVLGWSVAQLTVLGIIGSVFAVAGGFVGGMLDRFFGPKRALMVELTIVIALGMVQLSITPDAILFGLIPAGHTVWEGGLFPLASDIVYLSILVPSAIFLVASIASSRYMLVHICPQDKVGEFFGFYAMAGSVTVWMGPGLVALFTWLSGNQRIGFASVMFLLILGLVIISTVKADKTPEHQKVTSA
ncbi:MAG: MFS transporter [Henriciella sp.]|nr:MFS transporter [Henriciella sp.]